MKINRHIFHLPPFLSTTWKTILALHLEKKPEQVLIISLTNGLKIEIPNLDPKIIQAIFTIHAQVLEQEHAPLQSIQAPPSPPLSEKSSVAISENPVLNIPLFPGMPNSDNLGVFMQHNSEQADAPNLPKELMEKITSLSKTIGLHDSTTVPKAEPHCNCFFCQIARAMHGESVENDQKEENQQNSAEEEEEITEEDLKFRTWDISQTADKLYLVSNPIDSKEYYSVFLGNPIGCTCGDKNCEHIRAVLST